MSILISYFGLILTALALITPANETLINWHQQFAHHVTQSNTIENQAKQDIDPPAYKPFPYKSPNYQAYQAQAKAAAVYELDSAQYLYAKDLQQQLPIASITKIVTALVILQNHSGEEIMTVPDSIDLPADAEKAGIRPGEKFKLSEAMRIMLIPSANDMAVALAGWDSGSQAKFADKMNQQAEIWSLKNSHFKNPTGLDEKDHYSSVEDLIVLATLILKNDDFKTIIAADQYTAKNTTGKKYELTSTNKLLRYDYIKGLKTGLTVAAGQTLVTLAEKSDHRLIGVVLNSPDRFQESKNMLDWAFANHTWK